MHDLDDRFSEWTVTVDELRQAPREVIAITTVSARGRSSAAPLQFGAATAFGFASDDRVARIRIYLDVQEALKSRRACVAGALVSMRSAFER
jgi:hypothetical protein